MGLLGITFELGIKSSWKLHCVAEWVHSFMFQGVVKFLIFGPLKVHLQLVVSVKKAKIVLGFDVKI